MAKLDTHIVGIPSWVDVMVETAEQREGLMDFYSGLYGWTWDVGEEQMGYYSIANLGDGSPVMGLGQGPGATGAMVPVVFATGRHRRDGGQGDRTRWERLHGADGRTRHRVDGVGHGPDGGRPRSMRRGATSRALASRTKRMHRGGSTTPPPIRQPPRRTTRR